jgi:S-adenosylmethionine-diacylglycerol 3-amino-3-carboxypropyl transferase
VNALRLKFAVVREDPEIEESVARRIRARSALLVCSGGCTALHLHARLPDLALAVFDIQPVQLEHLARKVEALRAGDLAALNVEDPSPDALNQRGSFEGLFRVWSHFVGEFIASRGEIERFFQDGALDRPALVARWRGSAYWPASFEVTFAEPFLHAMFGPDATQHAERGSYPRYFQRAFERGLAREDAAENPFLQHILLQKYLAKNAPAYTQGYVFGQPIERVQGTLLDVPRLERFDLFSLSNVFDWSGDETTLAWGSALARAARPGAAVIIRQLNNDRNIRRFFEPAFSFDDVLSEELTRRERSLFYDRVQVGFRVEQR